MRPIDSEDFALVTRFLMSSSPDHPAHGILVRLGRAGYGAAISGFINNMPIIRFRLNGVETSVDSAAELTFLELLRDRLGLLGSHHGCGAGQCGACHVLVDDHALSSCDMPLWALEGKDVTTIEGLGTPDHPHPLQRAFIAEQAMQCGYCVPGILISAAALLKRNPSPTETEVRQALDRNLCRCGAQNRMVRAVLAAAAEMAAP